METIELEKLGAELLKGTGGFISRGAGALEIKVGGTQVGLRYGASEADLRAKVAEVQALARVLAERAAAVKAARAQEAAAAKVARAARHDDLYNEGYRGGFNPYRR